MTPHAQPMWYPAKNGTGEEIPAFSLVKATGVIDAVTSAIVIAKPDADSMNGLWVTGQFSIPKDQYGKACLALICQVAYNAAATPAVGQEWGSKAGSFVLNKDFKGWLIQAGQDTEICTAQRITGFSGYSELWVEITGGSDGTGYSGKRKERAAGSSAWADSVTPAPLTWTSSIYRAPSVVVTGNPPLGVGQVVRAWPSPIDATKLETDGISRQSISRTFVTDVSATCSFGSIVLTKTTKTWTIRGFGLDETFT